MLQEVNLSTVMGESVSNDDVDLSVSNIVLTVGNSMMGDDGAGPLLAKMIKDIRFQDGACSKVARCLKIVYILFVKRSPNV